MPIYELGSSHEAPRDPAAIRRFAAEFAARMNDVVVFLRTTFDQVSGTELFDIAYERYNGDVNSVTACDVLSFVAQRLASEDRRVVELFNRTYKAQKNAGEVSSIDDWLRYHDVFVDRRTLKTWRDKAEGKHKRTRR